MSVIIHFPDDFLPHIDMWRVKGFANLEVTHEGARYRLSFVDLGNIKQGLTGQGDDAGHFAEPGMVAVQEISESIIRKASDKLAKSGYFATLVPVGSGG
jgi:hypothetical protein